MKSKMSFRRKQLLNWEKTASPSRLTDFEFTRWKDMVGGKTLRESIYKATENQLDDLYIIREETRLKI